MSTIPAPSEHQPYAERLLAKARKGTKLTTEERRHLVGWAMVHKPNMYNPELAELCGVSERTISEDRAWARKAVSEEVNPDDIGGIVADIRMTYQRFRDRLEKSTQKAALGTAVYLAHLKAIADYEKQYTELLQSLGVLPKNLGEMTKTVFEFKAFSKRGVVDTVPVIDGEVVNDNEASQDLPQLSPEDIEARKGFDAEFNMSHKFRALPSGDSGDGKNSEQSTPSPDPAKVP